MFFSVLISTLFGLVLSIGSSGISNRRNWDLNPPRKFAAATGVIDAYGKQFFLKKCYQILFISR